LIFGSGNYLMSIFGRIRLVPDVN